MYIRRTYAVRVLDVLVGVSNITEEGRTWYTGSKRALTCVHGAAILPTHPQLRRSCVRK